MSKVGVRIVALIGAAIVSGVSIYAAARFQREPPPEETPAPGMTVGKDNVALASDAPQWKVLRLGTAQAAAAHWTDPLPARIMIDETKLSRVGSPLAGRVVKVLVERGDRVKAGQPLFTVASPNVAELRAEVEKAQVDLDVAKANLERTKTVVEAHAAAPKEQLAAEQVLHQAEVALRLAQAKMSTLHTGVTDGNNGFSVTAPREGVVVEKSVSVAQNVSPDASDPLLIVADLSSVWAVADLFEADATQIAPGVKAQVTSPSLPSKPIEGVVEVVSQVVDPNKHTIPIRVKLDNSGGLWRPNVYAQVRFLTGAADDAAEVLASAVMTDGTQSYVYVQDEKGRFTKRVVTAGSVRDGRVTLLGGVKVGETVVEEGGVLLDNQIDLSN
jgi:RND family efflux transporter MFP subunit